MAVLLLTGVLLFLSPPASAHVTEASGPYRVAMGWEDEPALSGAPNGVEVALTTATGAPVAARAGALTVELGSGGAVKTLPLAPVGPGAFRAAVIPTRPGTYSFHVTGTVRGRPVDARATCSGRTFDCVTDASELQFPATEPSSGAVAERLDREIARSQRAAEDKADDARLV